MRRLSLCITFLLLLQTPARPALPQVRPLSGRGVLLVPPEAAETLAVYAEPGVHRVAELFPGRLPKLAGGEGGVLLAALQRSGGWLKVSYDDAERQGWIATPRRWQLLSWEEVLNGRRVRILPALKKPLYAVRSAPADAAPEIAILGRDQAPRVIALEGDWARISGPAGWFRWRDAEGRLTVAPEAPAGSEKR